MKQGDSGGPLVHFERNVGTLIGIVSFGPIESCGERGSAAVYTKVSKYVDWINEVMTESTDEHNQYP
ncbi:complement factor I-like protein [Leptotrombidium deliense]|uniref:Complement factor I-like protein n=1 Tax=Leptotrombidium deliense TaxID=299467 RepID=A0A443SH26_9ACAR|nr:complement factor I-like protein [Leptotrombidium deliense]